MKLHPILLAVGAAAVMAACNRPGTETTEDTAARIAEEQGQTLVRVIHAMPEVPRADVYIGQEKAFTGVEFGAVTPYKTVAGREFTIVLKPAGQEKGPVLLEAKQGVDPGGRYSILALRDRDGAAKLDIVSDDVEKPAAGKALVRVIHAAPEAGSVNVTSTSAKDDPAMDDIDYGSPARYEEVDPAGFTVGVEAKGQVKTNATAVISDVAEQADLEAGKAYTFIVTPGEEAGQPVQVLKVEDPMSMPAARQPDAPKPDVQKE